MTTSIEFMPNYSELSIRKKKWRKMWVKNTTSYQISETKTQQQKKFSDFTTNGKISLQ
jgi:hypothetical protein